MELGICVSDYSNQNLLFMSIIGLDSYQLLSAVLPFNSP